VIGVPENALDRASERNVTIVKELRCRESSQGARIDAADGRNVGYICSSSQGPPPCKYRSNFKNARRRLWILLKTQDRPARLVQHGRNVHENTGTYEHDVGMLLKTQLVRGDS